jgi:RHS repeat-associated protein
MTDAQGFYEQIWQYYPYGGDRVAYDILNDPNTRWWVMNRMKFTGLWRDDETGLDHTLYRKYSSTLGRWLSPDPDNAGADESNPQSWNAYSYVGNNPINRIDPEGDDYYLVGGEQCGQEVKCDKQGYVVNDSGSRVVVTDQQVLSGEVQAGFDKQGNLVSLTTAQGTFGAQFFDPHPQTYTISGAQANSEDYFYAVTQGVRQAGPTVNATFQGLKAFGYVVAPLPMAVAECAAGGPDCSAAGMALALVPGGGAEEQTAQQMISRLKRGSIMREFPSQFLGKTLREIKQEARAGIPMARKALKLLKDTRFNK